MLSQRDLVRQREKKKAGLLTSSGTRENIFSLMRAERKVSLSDDVKNIKSIPNLSGDAIVKATFA